VRKKITAGLYFIWINLKSQLVYKGIIIENYINGLVKIILLYYIWKAIYSGHTVIAGRTFNDMVFYLILSTYISSLFVYPDIYMLSMDIKKGNITYQLLKPMSFQIMFLLKNVGILLAMLCTMLPVFFVVCSVIFHKFILPADPILFLLFVILGFLLYCSFDFMLGILCFWTENCWGITYFKEVIVSLLSGALIPLEYYPKTVHNFISLLPFPSIIATPIKIYLGECSQMDALKHMVSTLIWCTVFFLIANLIYQLAKKQSTFNGG